MTETRLAAVIGVDAGGTKTEAALVAQDGEVLQRALAGPGNYQSVGVAATRGVYGGLLRELERAADSAGYRVAAAAFGLAGWDRPRDEAVLVPLVDGLLAPDVARVVVNDTYLILRAGTTDGVGVAVVSGTGSNCVACGPDGRRERIGGLAWEFGDAGSASDIGREGVRAAFRGEDGRGEPTRIRELLLEALSLERLDDLVDFFSPDADVRWEIGHAAPLVFRAAEEGDAVARRILEAAGRELGLCARILAERLFEPEQAFPLVMGGSVFQKGDSDLMRRAAIAEVARRFPAVQPVRLELPPIAGAVLLGLDLVGRGSDASATGRLQAGLAQDG